MESLFIHVSNGKPRIPSLSVSESSGDMFHPFPETVLLLQLLILSATRGSYAEDIINHCPQYRSTGYVGGQADDSDNYNVIVRGDPC